MNQEQVNCQCTLNPDQVNNHFKWRATLAFLTFGIGYNVQRSKEWALLFKKIAGPIPEMSEACFGIGTPGFTFQVWLSLLPFGNTFNMEISTIRSCATLVPVVSKSKKQIGFLNSSCMRKIYPVKVINRWATLAELKRTNAGMLNNLPQPSTQEW